jgi:hypothetical protein
MSLGLKVLAAVAATGVALSAVPASAQSPGYIQVGTLVCKGKGGVGFIIASKKTFTCEFKQQGQKNEYYAGSITNIGIDIGVTGETTLVWAVFTSSNKLKKGDLAGNYVGAGANASVAVGVGANALVGGSKNTIALQPFSGQAQAGLNVAVGVQDLSLVAR